VTLCFTCGLTPVVTNPGDIPTGPPASAIPSTTRGNYYPTCTARPGLTGTTTIFTTHTVTACGSQLTCPSSGYFIYRGSSSRPGQQVITTTNSQGSSIVFTQVPATVTPTQTGGGGNGGSAGTGGGGNGGSVGTGGDGTGGGGTGGGGPTVTATAPGTAEPTCPVNNGETYTGNMGMQYLLLCDTAFSEETLETQTQDRIRSCISACDMYNTLKFYMGSQCLGINYYPGKARDNCLLKAGSASVRSFGTVAGRLISPQAGGGNGTGPGTEPGDYGSTIVGSMSASPVFTTGPVRTETETTTTTTVSVSYVPSTVLSISTVYSGGSSVSEVTKTSISYVPASTKTETTTTTSLVPTTIYKTTTIVSSYISGGTPYITSIPVTSAIVSYIPASTQTVTTTTMAVSYVPSTIYGVSTAVSSFVSNGVSYVTSYGVSTVISISYVPASTVTTTTTRISYVPSTIYEVRTTVSTFVSNGVSYITRYGVSTAVSVSLVPGSTNTVTTTLISISVSVSDRTVPNTNQNTFGPPGSNTFGPPGPGGGTVTVTATPTGANTYGPGGTYGSGGAGGTVTITQGGGIVTETLSGAGSGGTTTTTVYITRTVAPSSKSSSSTCRTYATNYLNGGLGGPVPMGSFKRDRDRVKRSIFDAEVVIGENEEMPRPGEAPALWYHGLEDRLEKVRDYLEG
jgi:hypothetical protein